ncbi:antibiotic biosynthesis monooxygenase family protein [Nonomuraea zeae]|uniref:Antibiotic biosynthesis monooxygenase n=1 Tax=Nonomuraea zeae TaxID=1642303 RepID=A0A5S4GUU2_9ACTN|nr:antibiotic biosynthesis monooxygenase [Nonomuraea zeae]TMR36725.1 antibiotic biosynthesis monooxygenase [Nonomuraea zeae]
MTGEVRVLLYATAPAGRADTVERAYHEISGRLDGTPGLLGNELLGDVRRPGDFVVLSRWTSLGAFRRWEEGDQHRGATSPLRPLQDRGRGETFGVYEVLASYGRQE